MIGFRFRANIEPTNSIICVALLSNITKLYPPDALTNSENLDVIGLAEAQTLDELFRERVRRSPNQAAYSQFDAVAEKWRTLSWSEIAALVERWQIALREQGLVKGDRVAICFRNSVEWVVFDQAALRLGLVVVPLYTADRPDNMAYVLADSRAKLTMLEDAALWQALLATDEDLSGVETVLVTRLEGENPVDDRVTEISSWLPELGQHLERGCAESDDLASIVYTSGTTGRPKGVMLSHKNMLSNAHAGLRSVAVELGDRVLSFLPLSHTLERTVGYYASIMAGAHVSFTRSIPELAADMKWVKPQILISVPRIFERIYNQIFQEIDKAKPFKKKLFHLALDVGWAKFEYQQGRARWHPKLLLAVLLDRMVGQTVRAKLGGEIRMVIVGGAALAPRVSKTFISLGIPLLQGYGLTETSPIVSVNTPGHNRPETIGMPLRGVEAKIASNDELLVKGDNVMMGYWGLPEATANTLDGEWLKTGDRAALDEDGFLRIIGRIKDILVLANGEKVPPPDIEAAILRDHLFEQVIVLGEGRAYLTALVVLSELAQEIDNNELTQQRLVERITAQMGDFPGYARVRKVHICAEEWTIENGLLTPTLKMKREKILAHYQAEVDALYAGHGLYGS